MEKNPTEELKQLKDKKNENENIKVQNYKKYRKKCLNIKIPKLIH